jgi:membrane-associated phospholipid phosphatase
MRRSLRRIRQGRVLTAAWRPRGAIIATAIVTLALAIVLAFTIDAPVAIWARGLDESIRRPFGIITRYGQSDWLLVSSAIICLVVIAGNWSRTSRIVAAAWTEVGLIAGFLFFSIATTGIVVNIVKQFVGRARPRLLSVDGPLAFDPFAFQSVFAGFPSGHAQVMAVVSMTAILVAPRYAVVIVIPCLLIVASRVIIGAHYVSDVLVGFVFGAGFTWLYAVALANVGVAFGRLPGGRVVARTGAIRKAGIGRMLAGLAAAYFGRASEAAPPPVSGTRQSG